MTANPAINIFGFPSIPAYQPHQLATDADHPAFMAEMASANDAAPRYDTYAVVHKGMRACMAETLLNLGRVDAASEVSVAEALSLVDELLALCADHLDHENHFIHTALERAQPGSAPRCAADHVEHLAGIETLRARRDAVAQAEGLARERALAVLYRLLALFVAENFEHMNVEETAHMHTLWQYYTDAEIVAIEQDLIAHIKPDRLMAGLQWMLPFASRQERAVMLRGMKAGMPPDIFSGMLQVLRPRFRPQDWAAIALDLAD